MASLQLEGLPLNFGVFLVPPFALPSVSITENLLASRKCCHVYAVRRSYAYAVHRSHVYAIRRSHVYAVARSPRVVFLVFPKLKIRRARVYFHRLGL